MTDVVLAIIILLPALLTFLLKSNAFLGYLGLAAGYTLSSLAGSDISNLLDRTHLGATNYIYLEVALLAIPLVLTLVFSHRSWKKGPGMMLNLVAAILAGGLFAIASVPYLNNALNMNLYHSQIWPVIEHARAPIIIAGVLLALIMVWLSKTPHPDKKHK